MTTSELSLAPCSTSDLALAVGPARHGRGERLLFLLGQARRTGHGIDQPQAPWLARRGGGRHAASSRRRRSTPPWAGRASDRPPWRGDRSGRRPRAWPSAAVAKSWTRNDSSNSIACASSDLISTVGAGAGMIELLLSSTLRMTSEMDRGRHGRHHPDAELHAVTAVGAAELVSLRLGQTAVGQHDEIVRAVEQVGRPPVGLDHTSFDAVVSTIQSPTS